MLNWYLLPAALSAGQVLRGRDLAARRQRRTRESLQRLLPRRLRGLLARARRALARERHAQRSERDRWTRSARSRSGAGLRPGEDFPALLDRLGIDLFLGIRLPEPARTAAAWLATTAHLENTPGWIPIFRNLYERGLPARERAQPRQPRSDRATTMREQGVPFDRERGFDVDAVIRDAPDWAIASRRRAARVRAHGAQTSRRAARRRAGARPHRRRSARCSADTSARSRSTASSLRAEPGPCACGADSSWSLLRLGRFGTPRPPRASSRRCPSDALSTLDRRDGARGRRRSTPNRRAPRSRRCPFLTRGRRRLAPAAGSSRPPRPPR